MNFHIRITPYMYTDKYNNSSIGTKYAILHTNMDRYVYESCKNTIQSMQYIPTYNKC